MKAVAVTGITGTFGRAFLKMATRSGIERLVGVSRDELKQSEMAVEFESYSPLRLFLGDVRDVARLSEAFYHCDTVIHAAALKRVDAVAYNPGEVVKTNVVGTENVIRAALAAGVKKVLVISSDKAVAPTNIYGASKSMAEHVAVQSNSYTYPQGTRVSVLRYGNVIGSRGSVIETWKRQIKAGQPVGITDVRMARFMLTIDEAVAFACQCVESMEGGELFVPKVRTARMIDLAGVVAQRLGVPVNPTFAPVGYPWKQIGLRPGGEKIVESLLSEEEAPRTLALPWGYLVAPHSQTWRVGGWPGIPMGADFRYVSDGSFGFMGLEDIWAMLDEAGL